MSVEAAHCGKRLTEKRSGHESYVTHRPCEKPPEAPTGFRVLRHGRVTGESVDGRHATQ